MNKFDYMRILEMVFLVIGILAVWFCGLIVSLEKIELGLSPWL